MKAGMGIYLLLRSSNQHYYFLLRDEQGQDILTGDYFLVKQSVLNALAEVRQSSMHDANFARETHSESQHCFVLRSSTGLPLGRGSVYPTANERDDAIVRVMLYGPFAPVRDEAESKR